MILDRCEIECAGDGDPVRLAKAIHAQLPELTDSVPVHDIALALDITEIRRSAFSGIEAVLFTDAAKTSGMIGVRQGARPERERFSVAHELGHFLNWRHQPTNTGAFACDRTDMSSPIGATRHVRQEAEANSFAIELLTPQEKLGPILRPSADLDRALRIATRFDISTEAALRRYVDLHLETMAVAFCRDGAVRYIYRSATFPWIPLKAGDRVSTLPDRGPEATTTMEEVDARDWLTAPSGRALFAQTLFQQDGYSATLLLLDEEGEEPNVPRFR